MINFQLFFMISNPSILIFFSTVTLFSMKGEKKTVKTFTLVGSDMTWKYLYPESKKSWLRTEKGTWEDFLWI